MPTLLFRFPAHRYHATPWGHHVNEGQIEWPPSPWRVLRALIATGYRTMHWSSDPFPQTARSLIEKLSTNHPRYRLPQAATGHSRHYMPIAKFKKSREDTTLVFDTWAWIENGELSVMWDVDLDQDERSLLAELAERMGHLGRSESWVEARLAQDDEGSLSGSDCIVDDGDARPGKDWEQVSLLAPVPFPDYAAWREHAVLSERAQTETDRSGKKRRKKGSSPETAYPADTLACLQVTTNWLRRFGWSQPPGSERVLYWRRRDALQVMAPRPSVRRITRPSVASILLAIRTDSGNDHALPSVFRTLPQAELLHRSFVSTASRDELLPSSVLTGQDEEGHPLRGPHQHAHVLPLDLDGDGHLDHVLLWAPMGFDGGAQAAVRAVRFTYSKGISGSLRVFLVGMGSTAHRIGIPGALGEHLERVLPDGHGGTRWRTLTPFVPPRYVKKTGKNTVEGQIRAELDARGLPEPRNVRVLAPNHDHETARMRHFVRTRRWGPKPPIDVGFSVELTFSDPVHGPICLGYGSHFGLGLFEDISRGH